jgi:O-antigen ligase
MIERMFVGALALFAATMAVAVPRLPFVPHAAWADLAAAAAVGAAVIARARRMLGATTIAGLAYAAWIAVAAAGAGGGWWRVAGALELVAVMAMASTLLPRERDVVVRGWIAGAAALSLVGLVVAGLVVAGVDVEPLFAGGGELGWRGRPAGLCRSGMLAQVALAPLMLLLLDGNRLVGRRLRVGLIALLAGTVALTLTRTILAILVAVAVALASRRPRLAAVVVALASIAALASVRLDVHHRDEPGIRWRIVASAAERARAHPLTGIGPGEHAAVAGWPSASDPPLDWDAHSTAFDLAATVGLPGLALFLVTFGLAARRGWRAWRSGALDATGRALVVTLAATAFDALTVDVEDFRHVWLLAGLVAACESREKAKT